MTRHLVIQMRVSPEERATFEREAKAEGKPLTEWMREALLRLAGRKPQPDTDRRRYEPLD